MKPCIICNGKMVIGRQYDSGRKVMVCSNCGRWRLEVKPNAVNRPQADKEE